MAWKLKDILNGRSLRGNAEASAAAAPETHVGPDFMAQAVQEMTMHHHHDPALTREDKVVLGGIARFMSVLNEQTGIQATMRDFDYVIPEAVEMKEDAEEGAAAQKCSARISFDIAAHGLNRKIKEIPAYVSVDINSGQVKVGFQGQTERLANGKRIDFTEAALHQKSFDYDLAIPAQRAELLVQIAILVAAEKAKQRFKDRAKGHVQQSVAMYGQIKGMQLRK